jgi:hypothetical protein
MQEALLHQAIGDWQSPLPHPRLRIYRNNVSAALVNALKVRFPVTEQLVGSEFFFAMAREFADANRPQSAVLIDYGAEFPGFVRDFAPAASVAYLSDVAALENLWWRAYHAAEAPPLAVDAFSEIAPDRWGELRFVFHPSAGMMKSPHAAGSIWLAHHGGPPMNAIRTDVAEAVLVTRPHGEVGLRIIQPSSFAFLGALAKGERLADAVEQAQKEHPEFDIGTHVQGLLSLHLLQGYIL